MYCDCSDKRMVIGKGMVSDRQGEREGKTGEAENSKEAKGKSRDQKEKEGAFPRKEKLEEKAIKCQTCVFPPFTLFQLTHISWDQFVDLRGYSHFSLLNSLGIAPA